MLSLCLLLLSLQGSDQAAMCIPMFGSAVSEAADRVRQSQFDQNRWTSVPSVDTEVIDVPGLVWICALSSVCVLWTCALSASFVCICMLCRLCRVYLPASAVCILVFQRRNGT